MRKQPDRIFIQRTVLLLAWIALALGMVLLVSSPTDSLDAAPATQSAGAGSVTAVGVFRHGALNWHELGRKGKTAGSTPVKVGIIDVGFHEWEDAADLGDLPDSDDVHHKCWEYDDIWNETDDFSGCEAENSTDDRNIHGTIVTEVLYDMAPEVELYITNPPTEIEFSAAINWLLLNRVDVINYSVGSSLRAPGNGDVGYLGDHVSSVIRAIRHRTGPVFVNSAGNDAQKMWYGEYHDSDGDGWVSMFHDAHATDDDDESDETNSFELDNGKTITIEARWQDKWGRGNPIVGAQCDLEIRIVREDLTIIKKSFGRQNVSITDFPYEAMNYTATWGGTHRVSTGRGPNGCSTTPDWVQFRINGPIADLNYATHDGSFAVSGPNYYQTSSVTEAKPAASAQGALLVAASLDRYAGPIVDESQRGPTLDNRLSYRRPDLSAMNCAASVTDSRACGTSIAAPRVAGLAALVKGHNSTFNGSRVANYLHNNAQDRNPTGWDPAYGYGAASVPGVWLETVGGITGPMKVNDDKSVVVRTPLNGSRIIRIEASSELTLSDDCTNPTASVTRGDLKTFVLKACSAGDGTLTLYKNPGATDFRSYDIEVSATTTSAVAADTCLEILGVLTNPATRVDTWASDCPSTARSGRYARYYSFTLAGSERVEMNLTSGVDPYLALRRGEGRNGTIEASNDNVGSRNSNSSINRVLSAGTYTVEATTYFSGQTGSFTLSVRPLQGTENLGRLTRSVDRSNSVWVSNYASTQQGRGYARSYTFTLAAATHVVINLTSSENPYLYVLRNGTVVHENDNVTTRNLNSRIDETLQPGTYTIEATTYFPARTGTFHLSIGVVP